MSDAVMVPRVPTEAMLDAADEPFFAALKAQRDANVRAGRAPDAGYGSGPISEAIWSAMLAASTPVGGLGALQAQAPSVPTQPSLTAVLALLEDARSMMRIVSDGFEEEGDRTYLGSTNHADWLRAKAEKVEAYMIENGVEL